MDIINIENHLKSLWDKPVRRIVNGVDTVTYSTKRSLELIVPEISWDETTGKGSLNNKHWAYDVGYSFRAALDLSRKPRMKDKKPRLTWTQGYKIAFKEGDLLRSSKDFPDLQVQSAKPIAWDDIEKKVYLGVVNFELFEEVRFGHVGNVKTVNQMEFLHILLFGII
jgi:hypothetical protein